MIDFNSIESISNEILNIFRQKDPFRFLDRVVEIDDDHIIGQYTFKRSEYFYKGHFPDHPLTPGAIMIETMAQTGGVAFGIYLLLKEQQENPDIDPRKILGVMTDVEAEFLSEIGPGETVIIKATKIFWRRRKLKSKAELIKENGELANGAEAGSNCGPTADPSEESLGS